MERIESLNAPRDEGVERSEAFINTGLINWEAARQKWLDYSGIPPQPDEISQPDASCCLPSKKKKKGAQSLNVDEIIDLIVSNRWRMATKGGPKDKSSFDKPVPLPQMIDILVDLWEAEES